MWLIDAQTNFHLITMIIVESNKQNVKLVR